MKQVLDYLLELREERRRKKLIPDAVPFADLTNIIMNNVREDLNKLYRERVITVYQTLNSKSISINELQDSEGKMAEGAPESDCR